MNDAVDIYVWMRVRLEAPSMESKYGLVSYATRSPDQQRSATYSVIVRVTNTSLYMMGTRLGAFVP